MMKQSAIRLLVLVAAVLLLGVSCYWTPQDEENVEGSLSLDMSGIATQAGVTGDTARVYLLAERGKAQGLYPLGDGEDYVDVDVDDTLTIDGIAPGYSYRVLISFGTDRGSWFEVTEYAESEPIEVESGSQVEVEVSVEVSPFVYPGGDAAGLNGKELNGVVAPGRIYVADERTVYELTNLDTLSNSVSLLPTINGISRGDTHDYIVNTDEGLFYGTVSDLLGALPTRQTDYTGAVTLSAQFTDDIVFQGPGIIGGAIAITAAMDDWTTVDVSGFVAGSPIRDYAIDTANNEAVVVSALGTFRASVNDFGPDEDWDSISADLDFLEEHIPARILSVGYNGTDELYVGTDNGIYTDDGAGPLFGSDATIIRDIASGSGGVQAYLGPYFLFLSDGSRIPFVAGFPGNPNDMTWGGSALFITGDQGIVRMIP
jgi:hypothetical protein